MSRVVSDHRGHDGAGDREQRHATRPGHETHVKANARKVVSQFESAAGWCRAAPSAAIWLALSLVVERGTARLSAAACHTFKQKLFWLAFWPSVAPVLIYQSKYCAMQGADRIDR
jgi:hypothetical protein